MKKIKDQYSIGLLILVLITIVFLIIRDIPLSNSEIGLVGALLGGFISGGLTLVGVKATIENQGREKFIDMYPERKMLLDNQLEQMKKILKHYNHLLEDTHAYRIEDIEQMKDDFSGCIQKSTTISGEVYNHTKAFQKSFNGIETCTGTKKSSEIHPITGVEITYIGGVCITSGKENEYYRHLRILNNSYDKIEKQLEDLDDKYNKLTGM
ncbi:hypothetical protein [Virgibacillus dokdonensis]|uniref:Uncharacterized protein n=1 Tax=Virgibacillus dokdonensis TaxID=302167 RepID=A0ABU7VHN2_9BACI